MFIGKNRAIGLRPGFGTGAVLAILISGTVQPNFAENVMEPIFKSAQEAATALYAAVKNNDQAAMSQLVGPLDASGDLVQDKADRERFIRKYSEMHRLVRQPDGTTVLYIGAENWPFPVPLISQDGKWRFDVDAGAQEVMFRSVGENETTAIETCRAIARAIGQADVKTSDTAINDYVQKILGTATPPAESFHGYRFRLLRASNGAVAVAYPSEYGSTGVMTFTITRDGTVYERDLGPKTVQLATTMTRYKADRKWHIAEQ